MSFELMYWLKSNTVVTGLCQWCCRSVQSPCPGIVQRQQHVTPNRINSTLLDHQGKSAKNTIFFVFCSAHGTSVLPKMFVGSWLVGKSHPDPFWTMSGNLFHGPEKIQKIIFVAYFPWWSNRMPFTQFGVMYWLESNTVVTGLCQ